MVSGVGWAWGWGGLEGDFMFFCVLFFCFVLVLSVIRAYRILAYAMIVSL